MNIMPDVLSRLPMNYWTSVFSTRNTVLETSTTHVFRFKIRWLIGFFCPIRHQTPQLRLGGLSTALYPARGLFRERSGECHPPARWGWTLSLGVLFLIGLALSVFAGWVVLSHQPHLPDMVEVGAPYMLAAAVAFVLLRRRRETEAWMALCVGSVALAALLVFVITPPLNAVKPSRVMGQHIAARRVSAANRHGALRNL